MASKIYHFCDVCGEQLKEDRDGIIERITIKAVEPDGRNAFQGRYIFATKRIREAGYSSHPADSIRSDVELCSPDCLEKMLTKTVESVRKAWGAR